MFCCMHASSTATAAENRHAPALEPLAHHHCPAIPLEELLGSGSEDGANLCVDLQVSEASGQALSSLCIMVTESFLHQKKV
jgi:hypothetical protein